MLLDTSLPGQAWDRLPRFFVGWAAAVQRGKITRPVFYAYTETGGGAHPRQSGIQRGDKGLSVPFLQHPRRDDREDDKGAAHRQPVPYLYCADDPSSSGGD